MTSTIKVNNIQNQCGANIINENSNTITIGASGDTIALASGASQTGFGREGSVNWQTGSIKTSTFTAVSGEGYFINQSSGITANLPAGSAGAIVAFSDYARNFATYNFTISPNGSEKIGGVASDLVLNVNGQAITLVYVDSTKGWVNVQNAEDTETGVVPAFVAATGGTVTTVCTNFKVHTFTGPGTFCVSCAGNAVGSNTISYMVVAGGGGGGSQSGGGGGAGGFREGKTSTCSYSASPLNAPAGLPVSAQGYPITVGAGGAGAPTSGNPNSNPGSNGNNSIFAGSSTITSTAGGGGGSNSSPGPSARTGGSGGAMAAKSGGGETGGAGNTPPVSPPQGNNGGDGGHDGNPGFQDYGGGGGGATTAGLGGPSYPAPGPAVMGGTGATTSISGSPTTYAGGGGGGNHPSGPAAQGGPGGGGVGGVGPAPGGVGGNGTANTGGGGGGSGEFDAVGGTGGSGIVIIRYKFQ
jgi:hypothetical protein